MKHVSKQQYRLQMRMRLGGLERLDLYKEDVDPQVLFSKHQGKCGVCHKNIENKYQIDHIHPISEGGEHSYDNLQPLHTDCHKRKTGHDYGQRNVLKRNQALFEKQESAKVINQTKAKIEHDFISQLRAM